MRTLSRIGMHLALACIGAVAACGAPSDDETPDDAATTADAAAPRPALGTALAPGFDAALAADGRAQDEKNRDAARQPREVLEFAGIVENMVVLDYVAGGGWYTEVLSAAVGPRGRVIAHNTPRSHERAGGVMSAKAERLGNVELLVADIDALGLDGTVDAALTALNLHDFYNRDANAAVQFLRAAHDALQPGGVLVVIDHEGSQGLDNGSLHRIPLATAEALLKQAGFGIEEVSDILDNPADDHTLNIRDASLGRNTDRFLIRARKPG